MKGKEPAPAGRQGCQSRDDRAWRNLKWLMLLRLAVVVVALGITVVSAAGDGRFYDELYPTYILLVVVCLSNLGYLLCLGHIRRPGRFAAMQILFDVLFTTVLVYVNGAGNSNVTWIYFGCILAAATLVGPSAGLVVASLSTILLANVTMVTFLGETRGWDLPGLTLRPTEPGNLYLSIAYLLAQGLAYHLVAILSGRLVSRLRGTRIVNEEILQNINEGVLVADADLRVVYVNHEGRFLLGLSGDRNLDGLRLEEVVEETKNRETLRPALTDRNVMYRQMELSTRAGRRVPVAFTSRKLTDEHGRGRGMVWLMMDLTERRRMEEVVEQARKMELVGQLSASIAHEIRNPLASVRGSAQELSVSPELSQDARRLMEVVVSESDRINAVITEFLQFAGMRKPTLKPCNVMDVLTDVKLLLEGRYPEANHHIQITGDTRVFCRGDAEQLRQVFLNLGLNALEAMEDGGTLQVGWTVRRQRAWWLESEDAGAVSEEVRVTFADQGPGFDLETSRRIFEPFFTTKSRGTGLGLAVARRIVEAHNGRIDVVSKPGTGSVFTVSLKGCESVESVTTSVGSSTGEEHGEW